MVYEAQGILRRNLKGRITLRIVSLAFLIFFLHFLYQHVGIQNASENAKKRTREKRKQITQNEKDARTFFYITLRVR